MTTNDKALYPRVEFRAKSLLPELEKRKRPDESLGDVAEISLERYYHALDRELQSLAFTHAEASLLADALNGTLWDVPSVPLLWAQVDDAIKDGGLDTKWGVHRDDFVARLRSLSYTQALSVIDAVDRFWRVAGDDLDAALRESGLTG